ncbi:MAG: DUF2971 domain-containing protein [Treponema sp.]|nr:DUF2971 domain-containing protein [Treponema sp.]MCL2251690.1 DUF2971 domain-containing protein [Treponema sp.]
MISKISEEQKLKQLELFLVNNWENLWQTGKSPKKNKRIPLYHYTSIDALFSILENDTLRFSNLRLSNDFSEERLLGNKWLSENNYDSVNFIFCVGEAGNLLSQWRSYCSNGGAAIELDVAKPYKYYALHSDYNETGKYENIYSMAIPVLYTQIDYEDVRDAAHQITELIKSILEETIIKGNKNYSLLKLNDFVPYIKHFAFHEEEERRLLINNFNNKYSKCIGFRKLPNGTKSPYIDVICGIVNKTRKITISKNKIKKIIDNSEFEKTIIVPICSNQEELYMAVREYIKKDETLEKDGEIKLFCDGHIPIRSIKIGPMPDQERIKEQVQIYCNSKYWLQYVDVSISAIPYITSINSKSTSIFSM